MAKAIFTTKISPTYDDLPEARYHFPTTYLRQVEAALNDWIIYYEPRRSSGLDASRGGRQSYFATARVIRIEADPITPDHFYAFVAEYLEFDRAVPFVEGTHYYEHILQKADGTTNRGAFGRSVRNLSDAEYDLILQAGFAHVLGRESRIRLAPDVPEEPVSQENTLFGLGEDGAAWLHDTPFTSERPIIERLVSRPFRDKAFAAVVKSAYRDTCAITGIKIINGGGRSEVQAAHIRAVSDNGPDSVRNGIALSGTVHWMFDRGLISIDDDYSILTAQGRVPDTIERLIREDRRLLLPTDLTAQPHRQFLGYHRQNIFKG
jgi:putative restriction endonuclease